MTLFVRLLLGQFLRLFGPTHFNGINWLQNNEARRRFDRDGPFPVAIIYRPDSTHVDFVVDHMMVGLVVGHRPGSLGRVALYVQVLQNMDPVTVHQISPASFGVYYICEFPAAIIHLHPAQIAAMVQRARDMPRDNVAPVGLPAPLENVPGAALFFSPQLIERDSDDDSADDSDDDSADDNDEDSGDEMDEDSGYDMDEGGEHDSDDSCCDVTLASFTPVAAEATPAAGAAEAAPAAGAVPVADAAPAAGAVEAAPAAGAVEAAPVAGAAASEDV